MKNIFYSTILLGLITISSCSSPLSDTPVSDPGLITPTIVLQHIDDDYEITNKATACLTDKNGAYIELLEGDVKVEGDKMEFAMTCYIRTIDIKPQKKYNVTVTLADSTAYPFDVTTPSYFKKVKYPSEIEKYSPFEISWKSEANEETKVNFSVKDSADNWIVIFEEFTMKNSILIDPDNFPNGEIKIGAITLNKTVQGKSPNGFNGGSIMAYCTFERTVNIK